MHIQPVKSLLSNDMAFVHKKKPYSRDLKLGLTSWSLKPQLQPANAKPLLILTPGSEHPAPHRIQCNFKTTPFKLQMCQPIIKHVSTAIATRTHSLSSNQWQSGDVVLPEPPSGPTYHQVTAPQPSKEETSLTFQDPDFHPALKPRTRPRGLFCSGMQTY